MKLSNRTDNQGMKKEYEVNETLKTKKPDGLN